MAGGKITKGAGMQKAGRAAREGEPKVPLWSAVALSLPSLNIYLKWISRDKEE